MAIQSKYTNEQVEALITELLAVLDKHQAPTDLSLMVLGNAASHLLTTKVPEEVRTKVSEQFTAALMKSVR